MPRRRSTARILTAALACAAAACNGSTDPEVAGRLEFDRPSLDLGTGRDGQIVLRNVGGQAIGPVELFGGAVQDASGASVPGSGIAPQPSEIPTLNPGDTRMIDVAVTMQGTLLPGAYDAVLTARVGSEHTALLEVRFTVLTAAEENAASLTIVGPDGAVRTGDVVPLAVEVRDATGALLEGAPIQWAIEPAGAGYVGSTGQFVGYSVGDVRLTATVGSVSDAVDLSVAARDLTGAFTIAGRAEETVRYTSDLWLHGSVAYSGTWGARLGADDTPFFGNRLNVWDVSDPAQPVRSSVISVDARTVNDVKVRSDGALAVMTHEGSTDGLNGITLLDLSVPLAPSPVGRFTEELQSGVHNAWIEGDYVYLVVDGVGNGLRILDISNPAEPQIAARFYAGSSFLHDVYVRDGLAFLSHWNAGLVILDVGNGIAGGSPAAPVEVARLADLDGQTHNAWYWPQAGYVFVGEEDFEAPGVMHVVDVRNLRAPREVATFRVSGQTPHNFWLDESSEVLYLAWYGRGVRALDVSGDLLGELDRQGREIEGFQYNGGGGGCARGTTSTCTWAPQLHGGLVWVSDMNQGLVALDPS